MMLSHTDMFTLAVAVFKRQSQNLTKTKTPLKCGALYKVNMDVSQVAAFKMFSLRGKSTDLPQRLTSERCWEGIKTQPKSNKHRAKHMYFIYCSGETISWLIRRIMNRYEGHSELIAIKFSLNHIHVSHILFHGCGCMCIYTFLCKWIWFKSRIKELASSWFPLVKSQCSCNTILRNTRVWYWYCSFCSNS